MNQKPTKYRSNRVNVKIGTFIDINAEMLQCVNATMFSIDAL